MNRFEGLDMHVHDAGNHLVETAYVFGADAALGTNAIDETRDHPYDRASCLAGIGFLEAGLGISTITCNT